MESHRTNQPCKGCHQIMDPIGLALENFDAVGRWRTEDTGVRIDTAGQLVDGTALDGVESLRAAMLRYPDALLQTMTRSSRCMQPAEPRITTICLQFARLRAKLREKTTDFQRWSRRL
jgi:hypothetical protein